MRGGARMHEARRLEQEQINRALEERKIEALERIVDELFKINTHLSNVAELMLEAKNE